MKTQMKNNMKLLGAACLSGILITGCGTAPATGNEPELSIPEVSTQVQPLETAPLQTESNTGSSENYAAPTDAASENSASKWQVLPPETAKAVDADFIGDVWKIEDNSFSIAEVHTEILEDGSLLAASPSTETEIPDSELVPVIFDSSTHFYLRTIYDGGERYEDTEASFKDLELQMTVELKGKFDKDGFHATEIRLSKVA